MGRMKFALDAKYRGAEIASPTSLDGVVRALPGETVPLGLSKATKLPRSQQLLFLHRFLSMPLVPSYVGDPQRGGGLMLDRVLASAAGLTWWATLTGRLHVQHIFSSGQEKISGNDQLPAGSGRCNPFKHLLNRALYSVGLSSRILLGRQTSLSAHSELPGNKKGCHTRAMFRHKLQRHEVTMEAAWHEQFVETLGSFWDVPLSVSLDLASVGSTSGLSYCLGIHHNAGLPQECGKMDSTEIPQGALPGLCARAAISVEQHTEIWKDKSGWQRLQKPYNLLFSRPHVTMSAIIGGTFSTRLGGSISCAEVRMLPLGDQSCRSDTSDSSVQAKKQICPFSADLFASMGCTAQFGKFQRPLLDLTKLETRLDVGTTSAFAAGATQLLHKFHKSTPALWRSNELACPNLALMLQQQIAGPLCIRIDSRFSLDASFFKEGPQIKEIVYALDYSLKSLGAAKLLAWYSPTRQEGMVELRFLEK